MKMPDELAHLYHTLTAAWQADLLKRLQQRGIPREDICTDYETALEISESAKEYAEYLKKAHLAKGTWKETPEGLRYKEPMQDPCQVRP